MYFFEMSLFLKIAFEVMYDGILFLQSILRGLSNTCIILSQSLYSPSIILLSM